MGPQPLLWVETADSVWVEQRGSLLTCSQLFPLQAWRLRRMACPCSSSLGGGLVGRLCPRWWPNTRLWVQSSMCFPSAASSYPWKSSMPPGMAPSSTIHLCCPGTEGLQPSTGKMGSTSNLPGMSPSLSLKHLSGAVRCIVLMLTLPCRVSS